MEEEQKNVDEAKARLSEMVEKEKSKKSAPIHATETATHSYDWEVEEWSNSPNGEQVKVAKKTYGSRIHPNYIHIKCGACNHEFWGWGNEHFPKCPSCHFPLMIEM